MNLPIIKPENTLRDAIKEMADMNAGMVRVVFSSVDENATGAIVLLRGEDTQRYIDAIDQVESELEVEGHEG